MQDTNTGTALVELPPSDELPPTMEVLYFKPEIPDVEIKRVGEAAARSTKRDWTTTRARSAARITRPAQP